MNVFEEYLVKIDGEDKRVRMREVLNWVRIQYPELAPRIAWNQPMFTHHGTYIIGFSYAKQHMSVAPERQAILYFSDAIVNAGYEHSKELVRIKWTAPVNYSLLSEIIQYNLTDKAECTSFWRANTL